MSLDGPASLQLDEDQATKQNATVTVRFRPLSPREIRQGDEVAWYADGDTVMRSDQNPNVGYTYDRVFAPPTTTLKVYDVAAQHVVSSAMEGIHGTIIAYGVTSSGKTHTMLGDQISPGIIPLAVKDAFSIVQETPNREFLLRVSYLEIYNEVVYDLLNPAGQNLQIRNDPQGTFVEGIKEEVIISPAHALSLIAAGGEHRHDGSSNSNRLSSKSHIILTLTIESSSYGESNEGEAVTFSQLHLIDLAGPVNPITETPGVHRKGGSYFNESLLTLEAVLSELTDGKDKHHIPFRDSKLTRLLQSSLSGQGLVSLVCTVTPASSNFVETHNTLKFAHRAKHIDVQASQNKITDEKSLIKKYHNEIHRLKEELEPRLEQEVEAKSPLLARIQHLTKLILVSTKASQTSRVSPNSGPLRRHSFGEEEILYLPHKRRDTMLDNEINELLVPAEEFGATLKKKNRKGLLNWFNIRKHDAGASTLTSSDCDNSRLTKSTAHSTPIGENLNFPTEPSISNSLVNDTVSTELLSISHGEFPSNAFPAEETPLAVAARNPSSENIQTSECMEGHLSQAFQAKDSMSNYIVLQKSIGVNHEAQQDNDQEETVPREISAKPLQNKQQVSCLINGLIRLIMDMKQQMTSLEKQLSHSFSGSQVKVDKLGLSPLTENSFELEKSSGVHEAQQHSDEEKTVPREISAVALQNKHQKSSGVHEAQQHSVQEKAGPREISAVALQNKQQVSCLVNRLQRLTKDTQQKMASLEKQIGHSLIDSQVNI